MGDHMIKYVLAFLALTSVAFAQTVPNHAVPIGRGPGVTGFNSAAPGQAGRLLQSNGPGVDPTFNTVGSLPPGPYIVTGGNTNRADADRWVDNWVEAPEIGVDCTGVGDSTAAIQAFFAGTFIIDKKLMFPSGCVANISDTITIDTSFGVGISGPPFIKTGGGGTPQLQWTGTNGGQACLFDYTQCKFMFNFRNGDHPTIQNLSFHGDFLPHCPDGFLQFTGELGGFTGTNAQVIGNGFDTVNCRYKNFVGVDISRLEVNNHENYNLYNNIFHCSTVGTGFFRLTRQAVTNGTATVTAVDGPFYPGMARNTITNIQPDFPAPFHSTFTMSGATDGLAGGVIEVTGVNPPSYNGIWFVYAASGNTIDVSTVNDPYVGGGVVNGQRLRISYAGGLFETYAIGYTSSTQITTAASVPFSQSDVMIQVGEQGGIAIRNGASQNAIQQVFNKNQYGGCGYGIQMNGGSAEILRPSGGQSDVGIYIAGFTAQNTLIDFYASESDVMGIFLEAANVTPVKITNGRYSNGNQPNSGFLNLGTSTYFNNNEFNFGIPTVNGSLMNNFTSMGVVTDLGNLVGGSGYTPGVYLNKSLTGSVYGGNIRADITVGGGGAVTNVALTAGGHNAIANDVLTAFTSDIGGTGSGFQITVTGAKTTGGGLGTSTAKITSVNNSYAGFGLTTPTWTTSGLGYFDQPLPISLNDNIDSVTPPGQQVFGCFSVNTACTYIQSSVNPTISSSVNLHLHTSNSTPNIKAAIGLRLSTDIVAAADSAWTGISVEPSSGRLSAAAPEVLYQAAWDKVSAVEATFGLTDGIGFKANTPASVTGGTLTNLYGFKCDKQKITNITNGWCFYNTDAADKNAFVGGVQLGVTSLLTESGTLGFGKITDPGTAAGAAGGKIMLRCGTNAGSARLIAYAGTSTTPVTILDNIGSGVTGC
jgi:hypothetical protein